MKVGNRVWVCDYTSVVVAAVWDHQYLVIPVSSAPVRIAVGDMRIEGGMLLECWNGRNVEKAFLEDLPPCGKVDASEAAGAFAIFAHLLSGKEIREDLYQWLVPTGVPQVLVEEYLSGEAEDFNHIQDHLE